MKLSDTAFSGGQELATSLFLSKEKFFSADISLRNSNNLNAWNRGLIR